MFNIGSSPVDDMGALMANMSHPIARQRAMNSIAQKYGGVDKFAGYYSRLTGKDPQEVANQVRNSLLASGDSTDAAHIQAGDPTAAQAMPQPAAPVDPLSQQGPNLPTNPGLNANNVTPVQAEQRGYARGGIAQFAAGGQVIGKNTDNQRQTRGMDEVERNNYAYGARAWPSDKEGNRYHATNPPGRLYPPSHPDPWNDMEEGKPEEKASGGIVQHFDDGGFAVGNLPPPPDDSGPDQHGRLPMWYDGGLSGAPGAASAAAAPGTGGIVPPDQSQNPYAADLAKADQNLENYKAPTPRERTNFEKWLPVLTAGLGMGASKNLNPLGAISEGALLGVKQYGEQRKEDTTEARDDAKLAQQFQLEKMKERITSLRALSSDWTKSDIERQRADMQAKALTAQFDRLTVAQAGLSERATAAQQSMAERAAAAQAASLEKQTKADDARAQRAQDATNAKYAIENLKQDQANYRTELTQGNLSDNKRAEIQGRLDVVDKQIAGQWERLGLTEEGKNTRAGDKNTTAISLAEIRGVTARDVAGTNANSRLDAANIRSDAASNVATINAGSRTDVAKINAESRAEVAGMNNDTKSGVANAHNLSNERIADIRAAGASDLLAQRTDAQRQLAEFVQQKNLERDRLKQDGKTEAQLRGFDFYYDKQTRQLAQSAKIADDKLNAAVVPVWDADSATGYKYVKRADAVGMMGAPKQGITSTIDADGHPVLTQGPVVKGGSNSGFLGQTGTNQAGKHLLDTIDMNARLTNIQDKMQPQFMTYVSRFSAGWENFKDKAGMALTPQERQHLQEFTTFKQASADNLNRVLHDMSGAAVTESESKRFKLSEADYQNDGPVAYAQKVQSKLALGRAAVARYNFLMQQGKADTIAKDGGGISLDNMPDLINRTAKDHAAGLMKGGMGADDAREATKLFIKKTFGI